MKSVAQRIARSVGPYVFASLACGLAMFALGHVLSPFGWACALCEPSVSGSIGLAVGVVTVRLARTA